MVRPRLTWCRTFGSACFAISGDSKIRDRCGLGFTGSRTVSRWTGFVWRGHAGGWRMSTRKLRRTVPSHGFRGTTLTPFEALDQLELKHREVLVLHFLEDFSIAEIAQVIGCPEGTVKSRIHHAKRAMKEILMRG